MKLCPVCRQYSINPFDQRVCRNTHCDSNLPSPPTPQEGAETREAPPKIHKKTFMEGQYSKALEIINEQREEIEKLKGRAPVHQGGGKAVATTPIFRAIIEQVKAWREREGGKSGDFMDEIERLAYAGAIDNHFAAPSKDEKAQPGEATIVTRNYSAPVLDRPLFEGFRFLQAGEQIQEGDTYVHEDENGMQMLCDVDLNIGRHVSQPEVGWFCRSIESLAEAPAKPMNIEISDAMPNDSLYAFVDGKIVGAIKNIGVAPATPTGIAPVPDGIKKDLTSTPPTGIPNGWSSDFGMDGAAIDSALAAMDLETKAEPQPVQEGREPREWMIHNSAGAADYRVSGPYIEPGQKITVREVTPVSPTHPSTAADKMGSPNDLREAAQAMDRLKNCLDGLSWYSAPELKVLRDCAMQQWNIVRAKLSPGQQKGKK